MQQAPLIRGWGARESNPEPTGSRGLKRSGIIYSVPSWRDSRYRASATCFDVRLADSDAVRVELEHQEGPVMAVFLPYKKKRFGGGVEYGELRLGAADRQVWT